MKKILKLILKTTAILFILMNVIVVFHAYKFTHFYDAGEIHIKPNEQKTGWDKTKEILFGINALKQQNTIADSGTQTVKLTTKDGIELEGWYIPVDSAKGTVCMFHGHGGKKSGTNNEAEEFRKMGYNTFQLDFRAHGSSKGNTCTIGATEVEDVKLAYDYIKNKDEKNIVLWGISMGGSAVAKALNDYADIKPNKIILEMPFGTLSDAVEGRVKMMGLPAQPVSTLLTFWGGAIHGFWAFNYKPQEYAKKITCPTLLQWGANDPRVTKKEEETIFANLSTSNKKFVVYENSVHESLCTKENTKWVSEVSSFLK
ncbi:MAG: alpha/beta hydrolase [Ferruginibacter sp.]|nr:alpha/beta hydrolase [Ferruginibacter sp.]